MLKQENRYVKKFENLYEHPPLVTSVINPKPQDCVNTVKKAITQGTDAFIFQLERLEPKYKTSEYLNMMFKEAMDFPIMVTNYPFDNNKEEDDDALLEFEFEALKSGASCIDVRGNTFDREAKHELSFKPDVIEKQKRVINKIHAMGGQVIMSMHVWENLTTDEVISYGKEIESRGADIVKIVHTADTLDELTEAIKTTKELHKQIKVPVLHLLNGKCREIHRLYGTVFGSCLVFTVQEFIEGSSESQPLLDTMVKLRNCTNYKFYSDNLDE